MNLEMDEVAMTGGDGGGGGGGESNQLEAASGHLSASVGGHSHEEFISVIEEDTTAEALQKCEKWLLSPYRIVLKCLGWTSFRRDGDRRGLVFLRVLLVLFWTVLMVVAFLTQILSCFRRDQIPIENNQTTITCKANIISTFILTDFLLLASYFFGIYLFTSGATAEYLSNLAEQVFVKSSQASGWKPPNNIIITIGCYFIAGVVWIVLSFIVRVIHISANDLWTTSTEIHWDNWIIKDSGKQFLVAYSLLGFIIFDIVYVVAVMNYAAQSEMCIHLLSVVREMVKTKKYQDFDSAIKDIEQCRTYVTVLNGKTATATALILFNLGSLGLVAIISLDVMTDRIVDLEGDSVLSAIAAGLNAVFWIGLVSFPFLQAARTTSAAVALKATGPELRARPFEYTSTSQLELDSYVTFTNSVTIRATMFGIPVYPWMAYGALVLFTFTMLVLAQQDVYSFTVYL